MTTTFDSHQADIAAIENDETPETEGPPQRWLSEVPSGGWEYIWVYQSGRNKRETAYPSSQEIADYRSTDIFAEYIEVL